MFLCQHLFSVVHELECLNFHAVLLVLVFPESVGAPGCDPTSGAGRTLALVGHSTAPTDKIPTTAKPAKKTTLKFLLHH